jgi:hypothetical protein
VNYIVIIGGIICIVVKGDHFTLKDGASRLIVPACIFLLYVEVRPEFGYQSKKYFVLAIRDIL